MRLTQNAITAIKKPTIRLKLAVELECTDQSIVNYINRNEFNGPLTTAGALRVIREETKLSDDQILQGKIFKASA